MTEKIVRDGTSEKMSLYDWVIKREVFIQRLAQIEAITEQMKDDPIENTWREAILPNLYAMREEVIRGPRGIRGWLMRKLIHRYGYRATGL
jgi:hypothetical protein